MNNSKKYWQSLEHLNGDKNFLEKAQSEFAEPLPVDEFISKKEVAESSTSRRDFLKFLGFSVTAATLAACETPVIKSIPYVVKPESVFPGIPNYYASTYFDGIDYASILVKTREGRPIHIEGNKLSKVTKGGLNARINSSVLSLYDTKRIQNPLAEGNPVSWKSVTASLGGELDAIAASGGSIAVLTNTKASPSTNLVIQKFTDAYAAKGATVNHVTYDVQSASSILEANEQSFGLKVVPTYHFDKAQTVVAIGADFQSTWLNSVEYAVDFAKTRKPKNGKMSKHYQFESTMSLSGSNADVRGAVYPSEQGLVVAHLYAQVAKLAGMSAGSAKEFANDDNSVADKIANAAADLWNSRGKSLVVSNSNDTNVQILVNRINEVLGNYGSTINIQKPLLTRTSTDASIKDLMSSMKAGSVQGLIIWGCDPSLTIPGFAEAIAKVKTTAIISDTASVTEAKYILAENHYLESFNDFEVEKGEYSLAQPTINKLFNTKQGQDILLELAGSTEDFYSLLKSNWEQTILSGSEIADWNKVLHDGVLSGVTVVDTEITSNLSELEGSAFAAANKAKTEGTEVELYFSNNLMDGKQANNPWLQELPDPVSKVVWDNYIAMNPADMDGYEIHTAQETPATVGKLTVNGVSIELPVVASPGQKVGSVSVALGYGLATVDGELVGKNAYPMLSWNGNSISLTGIGSVENTGTTYAIASTQTHHTMMGRKIVNEVSLETFNAVDAKDSHHGWNQDITMANAYGEESGLKELDLWQEHPIEKGHRWGMSIDLNSCIGCGACVTSCHSENNVPVVGKDEVRRARTMSWLRIDRYFSSDADPAERGHGVEKDYAAMEVPSTYPQVVYQPVMCQHCNHAPCETVCPVAATTHSNEGLNQMTYNRCVGTRYCANNCPFKVRRFNWFNYQADYKFTDFNPAQDDLARMVLNPDVTVRARGVMEKCSMCVQRIQAGKLEAKKNGTPVQDGAIQTACSSACPTNAITFGDINDESTEIFAQSQDPRAYHLLEEIGVQPNIYYQTKVRNA